MAIRIRTVGDRRVALCAAETDVAPTDTYIDDADHYALAAKFALDWLGQRVDWQYPEQWEAMATQKARDGQDELQKWTVLFGAVREEVAK